MTRPGGVVAACVWDHGGRHGPLNTFWEAARRLDPEVDDESHRAGVHEGQLTTLFHEAGLGGVEGATLAISVEHGSFDEWWMPFTLGVGPAGSYVAQIDSNHRTRLEALCRELLPEAPFTIDARAWAARGMA